MNTTSSTVSAWYDTRDRAGERCECRGECGDGHYLDDGGGQCPVRDQWPDRVFLTITPAEPHRPLDDTHQLPAAALRMRCAPCWRQAHQTAQSRGARAAQHQAAA